MIEKVLVMGFYIADGFVIVDKNSEGLDEGQEVEVYVYS